MRKRRADIGGDPLQHTAIIGDVRSMWGKLVWDVYQFSQIQRSNPDLKEPLGYAAINVCIAAASLADWTVTTYVKMQRDAGRTITDQEVRDAIYSHVIQQRMCEAIANTAKHARLREAQWPEGAVVIEWLEDDENTPPGYIMRHIHEGTMQSIAFEAFSHLEGNWWGFLQNLGFAFPATRTDMGWWQQEMQREFGHFVGHGGPSKD